MEPTSKEYFNIIYYIREELCNLKTEQKKLRFQITNLFEQNQKLTNELKENVEMKISHPSESDVGKLEQALKAAVEAKNAALEMWQAALDRLAVQEELLVGKRSIVAAERSELEKQFEAMKKEYLSGVNVLSKELISKSAEISRLNNELDLKVSELENYKSDINLIKKEIEEQKELISKLSETNTQLKEETVSLQSSLTESKKAIDLYKEEISSLTARNSDLSDHVSNLDEQNKKLKSDILIFKKDAKDSLLAAQQAILQKQEIVCKEEQYQNEIKMIKSSIEVEKGNVISRFKAEMKSIKKDYNEKIQNLISEIQNLHKEIGEKQNLFERANREKQALESKLDLLNSESSSGVHITYSAFDDMCKRLTMAERSRDEYRLKVSSLEFALQDIKSATSQEMQYHIEKQKNLSDRLSKLSKDFSQISSDRVKLSDEVTKLKKMSSDLKKELTAERVKYLKDVSSIEEESRCKLQMLQEQFCTTEEHYKNVCSELYKLLDAEFEISNKLKSEIEYLISQSEVTIKELLQEKRKLKNNSNELINVLLQNNLRVPNEILISLM